MRSHLTNETTEVIKKDFKLTLAFSGTEDLIARAIELAHLQTCLLSQVKENLENGNAVIPMHIFQAAQVGIDRQIDHFGIMSHMSYRTAQHHWLTFMLLRTNYTALVLNARVRLRFFFAAIVKHNEHLALHDQIMEYQALGNTSDSEYESDFSSDEDESNRKRTRMNANVLAKREAYLWDHDVAVNAETCGPGIKTRRKFYRKE